MAISGLNADSRLIGQGEVFFALPGTRGHGNIYGKDAAGRGAVAMVTDLAPKADPGIPVVMVDDVRAVYAGHLRRGDRDERQDLGCLVFAPDLGPCRYPGRQPWDVGPDGG